LFFAGLNSFWSTLLCLVVLATCSYCTGIAYRNPFLLYFLTQNRVNMVPVKQGRINMLTPGDFFGHESLLFDNSQSYSGT
jgi:hypothetical protein